MSIYAHVCWAVADYNIHMKRQIDHLGWQDIKPGLEISPIKQPEDFDMAALKIGQLTLQQYLEHPPRADFIPVNETIFTGEDPATSIARRLTEKEMDTLDKYKALLIDAVLPDDDNRINGTETRLLAVAGNRGNYHAVESLIYLRVEKPVSDLSRISAQKQVGHLQTFTSLSAFLKRKMGQNKRGASLGVDIEDLKLAPDLE